MQGFPHPESPSSCSSPSVAVPHLLWAELPVYLSASPFVSGQYGQYGVYSICMHVRLPQGSVQLQGERPLVIVCAAFSLGLVLWDARVDSNNSIYAQLHTLIKQSLPVLLGEHNFKPMCLNILTHTFKVKMSQSWGSIPCGINSCQGSKRNGDLLQLVSSATPLSQRCAATELLTIMTNSYLFLAFPGLASQLKFLVSEEHRLLLISRSV